eukprot:Gb_11622 [translate_table: standard]
MARRPSKKQKGDIKEHTVNKETTVAAPPVRYEPHPCPKPLENEENERPVRVYADETWGLPFNKARRGQGSVHSPCGECLQPDNQLLPAWLGTLLPPLEPLENSLGHQNQGLRSMAGAYPSTHTRMWEPNKLVVVVCYHVNLRAGKQFKGASEPSGSTFFGVTTDTALMVLFVSFQFWILEKFYRGLFLESVLICCFMNAAMRSLAREYTGMRKGGVLLCELGYLGLNLAQATLTEVGRSFNLRANLLMHCLLNYPACWNGNLFGFTTMVDEDLASGLVGDLNLFYWNVSLYANWAALPGMGLANGMVNSCSIVCSISFKLPAPLLSFGILEYCIFICGVVNVDLGACLDIGVFCAFGLSNSVLKSIHSMVLDMIGTK